MNGKFLLLPGLYRIRMTLSGGIGRLPARWTSKHRTPRAAHAHDATRPESAPTRPSRLRLVVAWLAMVLSQAAMAEVADTLLSVKPGVVGVGTFRPAGSPRANLQGTGFAVLDGRYVVSCAHIFSKPLDSERKETYAVFIGRDRQVAVRAAELVATNQARDLALLKIAGDPLPPLKLGDSSRVREGWQLYFTGYPIGSVLGLNPSTHRAGLAAIIPIFTPVQNASQLNIRALKQARDPYEVFGLDAVAYPGNSGSPVWHPDTGEVLGVVNSVYVKGAKEAALTEPSGISYAIPVKYVHELLEQALPKGP